MDLSEMQNELIKMSDCSYKEFQCKLMPSVNKDRVLGVRIPLLRSFAKGLIKNSPETAAEFMKRLPHDYYEEDNLHAFLIEQIKPFDGITSELERFFPYVDNWATCDMMNPKGLVKEPERLKEQINKWLDSKHTYTVRFAIKLLMSFFLDDNFKQESAERVAQIRSEEYYINMMIAWYFATALAKQYESIIPYLEEKRLPAWIHNKTIQKAIESKRISEDRKEYLRTLRIKI